MFKSQRKPHTVISNFKSGNLGFLLAPGWRQWRWDRNFFCRVWLEQSNYCLKDFCVCCVSGTLAREKAFAGSFFLSAPVGISRLPPSSCPSLGHEAKENPGNAYHVCQGLETVCLLSAFQSLLMFVYIFIMLRVFSCTRRNSVKYDYSI